MSKDVIIGVLIALSGVALTQVISFVKSFLDKKHENKKILREKYEEFFNAIYEINNWIKKIAITADKKRSLMHLTTLFLMK